MGPGRAAIFYNMLPVFTVLLGMLFLRETPGWAQLAGGGLVIGGSLAGLWPELAAPGRYPAGASPAPSAE